MNPSSNSEPEQNVVRPQTRMRPIEDDENDDYTEDISTVYGPVKPSDATTSIGVEGAGFKLYISTGYVLVDVTVFMLVLGAGVFLAYTWITKKGPKRKPKKSVTP